MDDILLSEYLSDGTMINGPYYVSIIERLRCIILGKRGGKVSGRMLLLDDNASIHKCNIAIRKVNFVKSNDPVYSPDISPSDCQT